MAEHRNTSRKDDWREIARGLPSAALDDEPLWREHRGLAERDGLEWTDAGDQPWIQIGRVRKEHLAVDAHGYLTTDESLIDWSGVVPIAGRLDAEGVRALDALRNSEIDPEIVATVYDALLERAVTRQRDGARS